VGEMVIRGQTILPAISKWAWTRRRIPWPGCPTSLSAFWLAWGQSSFVSMTSEVGWGGQ